MKKLTLAPDDLRVETFATGAGTAPDRGTVLAREAIPTIEPLCPETWLKTNPTCCPCTPAF